MRALPSDIQPLPVPLPLQTGVEDPFTRQRAEKRERVKKQEKQQLANLKVRCLGGDVLAAVGRAQRLTAWDSGVRWDIDGINAPCLAIIERASFWGSCRRQPRRAAAPRYHPRCAWRRRCQSMARGGPQSARSSNTRWVLMAAAFGQCRVPYLLAVHLSAAATALAAAANRAMLPPSCCAHVCSSRQHRGKPQCQPPRWASLTSWRAAKRRRTGQRHAARSASSCPLPTRWVAAASTCAWH